MPGMTGAVALQVFAAQRVAVLGTVAVAGGPHLVPVTFEMLEDTIVFAVDHKPKTTTALRRLANIEHDPQVCFLADRYDDDWEQLWWVRVEAAAEVVTGGTRHRRAVDALAEKYGQYRDVRPSGAVVISQISAVVGWSALPLSAVAPSQPRATAMSGVSDVPDAGPPRPEPDDKDWTWVLQRPCGACGYDAASVDRESIPTRLRKSSSRWRLALQDTDVTVRPGASTWSGLEYGCHVRDVHRIFQARASSIQESRNPEFDNWDQDETALARRYWEADPVEVATEIEAAADAAADTFTGLTDEQWSRPGRRSNGSVFTMETLGLYYLHDVEHHLHDVGY